MKNITPKGQFECGIGACPQIFEDGENLVIVGKITRLPKGAKISKGETAIMVPKTLFANFLKKN